MAGLHFAAHTGRSTYKGVRLLCRETHPGVSRPVETNRLKPSLRVQIRLAVVKVITLLQMPDQNPSGPFCLTDEFPISFSQCRCLLRLHHFKQHILVMATVPITSPHAGLAESRQIRSLFVNRAVPVHQPVRLPAQWHILSLESGLQWHQRSLRQKTPLSGRHAAGGKRSCCHASATMTGDMCSTCSLYGAYVKKLSLYPGLRNEMWQR